MLETMSPSQRFEDRFEILKRISQKRVLGIYEPAKGS